MLELYYAVKLQDIISRTPTQCDSLTLFNPLKTFYNKAHLS